MKQLYKITGFEWDKGNIEKNYQKHGITGNEAEEIFLDEHLLIAEDTKHSKAEQRYSGLGKSSDKVILFTVFTIRNNKIRIISVRIANKNERIKYESNT